MARDIPVYLFDGFLEAGKTSFIQDTLEDERFNEGENILVLLCEEGEVEYDSSKFAAPNVFIELLEDERKLNPVNLERLVNKHNAEMIIIEYNGMWMLDKLFQAMPQNWIIYQEMCIADSNTILSYNANMRQQTYDKLQTCNTIVFNRCKPDVDKMELHKLVRGANRGTDIIYEYEDGNIENDDIEDPLPFDVNAPVIEIADRDYAIWYRDMGEDMESYDGKTVRFKGICGKSGALKDGFVIGRQIMTCCVEDIRMGGLACLWDGKQPESGSWVWVTAEITIRKHKVYGGKQGPVLKVSKIEKAAPPVEPVCTFY